jgi:RNA polymerase nonessential primary-like sigma factor
MKSNQSKPKTQFDPLVWAAVEYAIEQKLRPSKSTAGTKPSQSPKKGETLTFPTLAEERQAIRRAMFGDQQASLSLVNQHKPIVDRMARTYAASVGLSFEDFQSEGNLALLGAIGKFDFDRGTRFVSYLQWWLKSAMQANVCDMSAPLKLPRRDTTKELTQLTRQEPYPGAYSELEIETDDVVGDTVTSNTELSDQNAVAHSTLAKGVSIDLIDEYANEKDTGYDRVEQQQLANLLANTWPILSDREQLVLDRYFGISLEEPTNLTEIGIELGVSRQRATQILDGALLKLKSAVLAPSDTSSSARSKNY